MCKPKQAYVICYRSKEEAAEEPKTPWVLFLYYENPNEQEEFIKDKMDKLRVELNNKDFIGGRVMSTTAAPMLIPTAALCMETRRKFDVRIKPNV